MTPTDATADTGGKANKAPPAAWVFFKRWLADPISMASIIPSSPALRKIVSKNIICGPDEVVVEFGGGTGAITKAILEAGVPANRVYSIEIDKELVDFLQQAYPDIHVVHGDARVVDTLIAPTHVGKVGTVIVGIPMVLLPVKLQGEIVDAIFRILPPGRRFLLYTYCATSPLPMEKLGLTGKRLAFTPFNFPFASVWAYERA